MTRTTVEDRGLTGRHVLAAMIAFFMVIIATDAVMVYKAVSTFGGIETHDAYRKGLAYNSTLAAAEQQTFLGWQDTSTFDASTGKFLVTLRDGQGRELDTLHLSAGIGRAATNAFDRTVTFDHQGDGIYATDLSALEPGGWIVALSARQERGDTSPVLYRSKVRLWIKP